MARTRGSGQELFEISPGGFGRVGSGQDVHKSSRVGPGHRHPTRPDPTSPARFDPTREQSWEKSSIFLHLAQIIHTSFRLHDLDLSG